MADLNIEIEKLQHEMSEKRAKGRPVHDLEKRLDQLVRRSMTRRAIRGAVERLTALEITLSLALSNHAQLSAVDVDKRQACHHLSFDRMPRLSPSQVLRLTRQNNQQSERQGRHSGYLPRGCIERDARHALYFLSRVSCLVAAQSHRNSPSFTPTLEAT